MPDPEQFPNMNVFARLLTHKPGSVLIVNPQVIEISKLSQMDWPEEWKGTPIIAAERPADDIRLLPLRKMARAIRIHFDRSPDCEDELYDVLLSQLEAD